MITNKRNEDCITFHLSYWYHWEGSRVLLLSMRYASLAFRTLSLLDLMSSSGISLKSLAEWSLVRKKVLWDCGWFRDVRWIVNGSPVFVETVFESSFRFSCVLFGAVVALHHVDLTFLGLQSMWRVISLVSPVAWNVYEVCPSQICIYKWDSFFPAWVWASGLVVCSV